jgi:DNA-binding transcriptional ArsR family regulator
MTGSGWTFLSNHTHVLVCLAADGSQTLREVAAKVGVTERAVQRIVADLEEGGVLERQRDGRRNAYVIHPDVPLRHPLEAHCRIGDLIGLVVAEPSTPLAASTPRSPARKPPRR